MATPHLQFLLAVMAGWMNRSQQDVIDYLLAENRVLREQLGPRRLRLSDAQRCRLAAAAKPVGRKRLFGFATIVTPDTLLRGTDASSPRSTTQLAPESPAAPRP